MFECVEPLKSVCYDVSRVAQLFEQSNRDPLIDWRVFDHQNCRARLRGVMCGSWCCRSRSVSRCRDALQHLHQMATSDRLVKDGADACGLGLAAFGVVEA